MGCIFSKTDDSEPIAPGTYDLEPILHLPVIFLSGVPGAGKQNIAQTISNLTGYTAITPEELERAEAEKDNIRGMIIAAKLSDNEAIPEQLTVDLIKEAMLADQNARGFVLVGFPKNPRMSSLFNKQVKCPEKVVAVQVDPEVAAARLQTKLSGLGKPAEDINAARQMVKDAASKVKICQKRFGGSIIMVNSGANPADLTASLKAVLSKNLDPSRISGTHADLNVKRGKSGAKGGGKTSGLTASVKALLRKKPKRISGTDAAELNDKLAPGPADVSASQKILLSKNSDLSRNSGTHADLKIKSDPRPADVTASQKALILKNSNLSRSSATRADLKVKRTPRPEDLTASKKALLSKNPDSSQSSGKHADSKIKRVPRPADITASQKALTSKNSDLSRTSGTHAELKVKRAPSPSDLTASQKALPSTNLDLSQSSRTHADLKVKRALSPAELTASQKKLLSKNPDLSQKSGTNADVKVKGAPRPADVTASKKALISKNPDLSQSSGPHADLKVKPAPSPADLTDSQKALLSKNPDLSQSTGTHAESK